MYMNSTLHSQNCFFVCSKFHWKVLLGLVLPQLLLAIQLHIFEHVFWYTLARISGVHICTQEWTYQAIEFAHLLFYCIIPYCFHKTAVWVFLFLPYMLAITYYCETLSLPMLLFLLLSLNIYLYSLIFGFFFCELISYVFFPSFFHVSCIFLWLVWALSSFWITIVFLSFMGYKYLL